MNHQHALHASTFTSVLSTLNLSKDQQRALLQACEQLSVQPYGLRAVWFNDVVSEIAESFPAHRESFETIARRLVPKQPMFSYLPVHSIFLTLAVAASLTMPSVSVVQASNMLVAKAIHKMLNQALLRPIVMACNGSYVRFMETMAQSDRLFYNYGNVSFQHRFGRATVFYDDHPAYAERYFIPGFWQGAFHALDAQGELSFEFDSPNNFSVHFAPTPPAHML